MISATGATNAATAAASTASCGVATSLSLTGTPSSRTRDHRQLASGHERVAGSPPIDALMTGTHARVWRRSHSLPAHGTCRRPMKDESGYLLRCLAATWQHATGSA